MAHEMKFSVHIDHLYRYHLAGICCLAVADIVTVAGFEFYHWGTMKGLTHLFSFEDEQNFPSLFSPVPLFALAFTCLLGARKIQDAQTDCWKLMAVVFCYLAIDEAVSIHE